MSKQRRSYIDETGDATELDAQWFREAQSIDTFPDLADAVRTNTKLGRPSLPEAQKKQRVTMHLDPDILAALKADGKGWQTRANAALRRALKLP